MEGRLHIIIFSRDRAFQLRECLRSLARHLVWPGPSCTLCISVLYSVLGASQRFEASYNRVREEWPNVRFVAEEEGAFGHQLEALLEEASGARDLIMWGVDDMLFFRKFDAG
jgi:hypothetical protein